MRARMVSLGIKKYKEIKSGSIFRIAREKGHDYYIKKDYYFVELSNPTRAYRPLWGGTHCEVFEI